MAMTIGAMARLCGLTTSALRFYDDSGLLVPAEVDPTTGYRYYVPSQRDRAVTIRRLREIDVPLSTISRVLDSGPDASARLLDEHVHTLWERARHAAAVVESLNAAHAVVSGILFAQAVEQVRSAAAVGGDFPVLTGIFVEVDNSSITLTGTDRYRLTTRSLAVESGVTFSCVVAADPLSSAANAVRDRPSVRLSEGLAVDEFRCDTIDGTFPDYRSMMDGFGPVATRVVTDKTQLIADVERVERYSSAPLGVDMMFDSARLLAALRSALGPEVMLDFLGPDLPLVVRSADVGDLTTLVMPVKD